MYKPNMLDVLPTSSISLIQNEQFGSLRGIYHNLDAPSEDQKRAFQEGKIILSSWEMLCMTLFKAVITESSYSANAGQVLHSCLYDS